MNLAILARIARFISHCLILLHFLFLIFGQFLYALYTIFVADHGLILHFDHNYILQANGENLAWRIIIHEDILTAQFLVMPESSDTLIVGGE